MYRRGFVCLASLPAPAMNRIAGASIAIAALLAATPASAVTNENGEVLITQAAINAGNITPGDTPGFPVTINVGGSYRLASNLIVTTFVNGIEVRANEVTIDLGGFTLAGSGAGRNGITSFNRNLKLSNGTVRGFINDGIRTIARFLTVRDLVVTGNSRYGIFTDPAGGGQDQVAFAKVENSSVTDNGLYGIRCGNNCSVESTVSADNGFSGILFAGKGGVALGNSTIGNYAYGIFFNDTGGGAGSNTAVLNTLGSIVGTFKTTQPNNCDTACPPP